jgi:osmotically-inducible protein OsmY
MNTRYLPLLLILLTPFHATGEPQTTPAADEGAAQSSSQPDIWIESKLVTTYTLNPHLNPFRIHVDVTEGVVTLSGKVESGVDRDLAEELARGIEGVKGVTNLIEIDETVPGESAGKRDFADYVNDANVTAKVKSRLLWNSNTEGLRINVSTRNGVVTLAGAVDSAAQRDLATQIARNTRGVENVVSKLDIRPGESLSEKTRDRVERSVAATKRVVSDSWITTKVYSSLTFERGIDASTIDVDTEDGVVTLSGTVTSESQRQRILTTAGSVVGVKRVVDELELAQLES